MLQIPLLAMMLSITLLLGFTPLSYSDYLSPRVQLESGVAIEDIQCKENRVLVIRTNGSPACVTERTAERLGLEPVIQTEKVLEKPDLDEVGENIIPVSDHSRVYIKSQSESQPDEVASHQGGLACPKFDTLSLDVPKQVSIGTEFDVTVSYAYILPDEGSPNDYENWEDRYDPDDYSHFTKSCHDEKLSVGTETFLKVLDLDYERTTSNNSFFPVDWSYNPPKSRVTGNMFLEFNNDLPQTRTVTLKAEEPRFGNSYGFLGFAGDDILGNVIMYYEIRNGLLTFGDVVESEMPNSYDPDHFITYDITAFHDEYESQFVKVTNSTYDIQLELKKAHEPDWLSRPHLAEGESIPTMENYAFWAMQNWYDKEDRIADATRHAETYAKFYPSLVSDAQEWTDELFKKYPEIKTQEERNPVEFPRSLIELDGWLAVKSNGFAEIYLTEKQFDADKIQHMVFVTEQQLQQSLQQDTILSGLNPSNFKDRILEKYPHLQTLPENREKVDDVLGLDDPALNTQIFFFDMFQLDNLLPSSYAQSPPQMIFVSGDHIA